jgi:hypothetical protein
VQKVARYTAQNLGSVRENKDVTGVWLCFSWCNPVDTVGWQRSAAMNRTLSLALDQAGRASRSRSTKIKEVSVLSTVQRLRVPGLDAGENHMPRSNMQRQSRGGRKLWKAALGKQELPARRTVVIRQWRLGGGTERAKTCWTVN